MLDELSSEKCVFLCVRVYVCVCLRLCVCVFVCVYVCECARVRECVCACVLLLRSSWRKRELKTPLISSKKLVNINTIDKNRVVLKILIDFVFFLGQHALYNRGNFQDLVGFIIKYDDCLKSHLSSLAFFTELQIETRMI